MVTLALDGVDRGLRQCAFDLPLVRRALVRVTQVAVQVVLVDAQLLKRLVVAITRALVELSASRTWPAELVRYGLGHARLRSVLHVYQHFGAERVALLCLLLLLTVTV